MDRRNIPEAAVEAILSQPEQVVPGKAGKDNRTIYQSRLDSSQALESSLHARFKQSAGKPEGGAILIPFL